MKEADQQNQKRNIQRNILEKITDQQKVQESQNDTTIQKDQDQDAEMMKDITRALKRKGEKAVKKRIAEI